MKKLPIFLVIALLVVPVVLAGLVQSKGQPEKIVFIHYKKGQGNLPIEIDPKCYKFISRGARFTYPQSLTIHPSLDSSAILAAASEWDSHTSAQLFNGYSIDDTADWDGDPGDLPDGRNEFSYGNYPTPGVIAVTVVWGYFTGPPTTRQIVEFDVMFDTDYTWGDATINETVMDLQNIATHEIGHGLDLADLYGALCWDQTMYGYSDYGETIKRTLSYGDIAGLQELYGV